MVPGEYFGSFSKTVFARRKTIQYLSLELKTLTNLGSVPPETREEESKKISDLLRDF